MQFSTLILFILASIASSAATAIPVSDDVANGVGISGSFPYLVSRDYSLQVGNGLREDARRYTAVYARGESEEIQLFRRARQGFDDSRQPNYPPPGLPPPSPQPPPPGLPHTSNPSAQSGTPYNPHPPYGQPSTSSSTPQQYSAQHNPYGTPSGYTHGQTPGPSTSYGSSNSVHATPHQSMPGFTSSAHASTSNGPAMPAPPAVQPVIPGENAPINGHFPLTGLPTPPPSPSPQGLSGKAASKGKGKARDNRR